MQQNLTDLTTQQLQAIELLSLGQSYSLIGEKLGLSRDTLWRWRKQEAFLHAIEAAKTRQLAPLRAQAHELMRLSLTALARELKKAEDPKAYNPINTAFKVLEFMKTSGLLSEPLPAAIEIAFEQTSESTAS
jgi:hypothetical protein